MFFSFDTRDRMVTGLCLLEVCDGIFSAESLRSCHQLPLEYLRHHEVLLTKTVFVLSGKSAGNCWRHEEPALRYVFLLFLLNLSFRQ